MSFLNPRQAAKLRAKLKLPETSVDVQKEYKRMSEQTLSLMLQNETLRDKADRLTEENRKLKLLADRSDSFRALLKDWNDTELGGSIEVLILKDKTMKALRGE